MMWSFEWHFQAAKDSLCCLNVVYLAIVPLENKTKEDFGYYQWRKSTCSRYQQTEKCSISAVRLLLFLCQVYFSGDTQSMWFCGSVSSGRYLQQEPLIANDCSCVPVDDLGERQLPAVTQHYRHTCSLKDTHTHTLFQLQTSCCFRVGILLKALSFSNREPWLVLIIWETLADEVFDCILN